jgi:hypothetical protein
MRLFAYHSPAMPDGLSVETNAQTTKGVAIETQKTLLSLPNKLLLRIDRLLGIPDRLMFLRSCKQVYIASSMRRASAVWKQLSDEPAAETTLKELKALKMLDRKGFNGVVIRGFKKYDFRTEQRKPLKACLDGERRLCTLLLYIDIRGRFSKDIGFLLTQGADSSELDKFVEWQIKNYGNRPRVFGDRLKEIKQKYAKS